MNRIYSIPLFDKKLKKIKSEAKNQKCNSAKVAF